MTPAKQTGERLPDLEGLNRIAYGGHTPLCVHCKLTKATVASAPDLHFYCRNPFHKGNKMPAPGFLDDLDAAGLAAWLKSLDDVASRAASAGQKEWHRAPAVAGSGDVLQPAVATIDWRPIPKKLTEVLSNEPRDEVDRFLDWNEAGIDVARPYFHEEYLEWRVVRDEKGDVAAVEMTSETPDYMSYVAGYNPQRLIALCAEFSGEKASAVDVVDIYGGDPFKMTVEERIKAFLTRHVSRPGPPASDYVNGTKAMLCMSVEPNALGAAVNLAVRAAYPLSSGGQLLKAEEAINAGGSTGWAVECRSSDPVITQKVINLVGNGQKISLVQPVGIYMVDFLRTEVTLDGNDIPNAWLNYSRGRSKAQTPFNEPTYQRLVIKPPVGSGRKISDLRDQNGDPVVSGLQLARAQPVALYAQATAPSAVALIDVGASPPTTPCGAGNPDAAFYRDAFAQWKSQRNVFALSLSRWRAT